MQGEIENLYHIFPVPESAKSFREFVKSPGTKSELSEYKFNSQISQSPMETPSNDVSDSEYRFDTESENISIQSCIIINNSNFSDILFLSGEESEENSGKMAKENKSVYAENVSGLIYISSDEKLEHQKKIIEKASNKRTKRRKKTGKMAKENISDIIFISSDEDLDYQKEFIKSVSKTLSKSSEFAMDKSVPVTAFVANPEKPSRVTAKKYAKNSQSFNIFDFMNINDASSEQNNIRGTPKPSYHVETAKSCATSIVEEHKNYQKRRPQAEFNSGPNQCFHVQVDSITKVPSPERPENFQDQTTKHDVSSSGYKFRETNKPLCDVQKSTNAPKITIQAESNTALKAPSGGQEKLDGNLFSTNRSQNVLDQINYRPELSITVMEQETSAVQDPRTKTKIGRQTDSYTAYKIRPEVQAEFNGNLPSHTQPKNILDPISNLSVSSDLIQWDKPQKYFYNNEFIGSERQGLTQMVEVDSQQNSFTSNFIDTSETQGFTQISQWDNNQQKNFSNNSDIKQAQEYAHMVQIEDYPVSSK